MSDHFTRLIARNSAAGHLTPASGESPRMVFICDVCGMSHNTLDDAEHCCPNPTSEAYVCGVCNEEHDTAHEAMACCGNGSDLRCPVCLKYAESYEDAADCCLHLHPGLTHAARQLIAQDVESGDTWVDAVKRHETH